jgi:hypothetical protein
MYLKFPLQNFLNQWPCLSSSQWALPYHSLRSQSFFYNGCARTPAMSSVLHLSLLPPFLRFALLSSLIRKTNGIPLSAENDMIHAVLPTCTTLQGGSTSCNVGINTLPSLVALDGDYAWLIVQPTTIKESGSILTTNCR